MHTIFQYRQNADLKRRIKKLSASAVMTDAEGVGATTPRGRVCAVPPSCRGCRGGVPLMYDRILLNPSRGNR